MIPAGNHTDLIWPLSLIPRKWTAVESTRQPYTYGYDGDVPPAGQWTVAISRYGFMFSANSHGWLFRIGTFRYDYVDKYYEFPTLTLKRHS